MNVLDWMVAWALMGDVGILKMILNLKWWW